MQNLQERLFYRTPPLAASRIYFLHLGPLILSFKKNSFRNFFIKIVIYGILFGLWKSARLKIIPTKKHFVFLLLKTPLNKLSPFVSQDLHFWFTWEDILHIETCFCIRGVFRTILKNSWLLMFFKISVLKNLAIFTEKTSVLESVFNEIAGVVLATFLKRDSNAGVYLVSIVKFLRKAFLIEHLRWLLLHIKHLWRIFFFNR